MMMTMMMMMLMMMIMMILVTIIILMMIMIMKMLMISLLMTIMMMVIVMMIAFFSRFQWSHSGPIRNLACMKWFAKNGSDGWNDNYLCGPQQPKKSKKFFLININMHISCCFVEIKQKQ